jgi:hypothetical protein
VTCCHRENVQRRGVVFVALHTLGNALLFDENDLAQGEGLHQLPLVLHRGDDDLWCGFGRHKRRGP